MGATMNIFGNDMNKKVGIAVVGAGSFARFAVRQFVKHQDVHLVCAYDRDEGAITQLQDDHPGVKACESLEQLLADPSVAVVYIGSPPFLHYEHSLAALSAGKHVICEKPAALNLKQAEELRDVASKNELLFVVNLMQRYNPLFSAVKELIDRQVLGAFLHGFFENYASDEFLAPEHWFWDEARSGGIFIEHGVHFFDMFAGWLGAGEVVSAQKLSRPGYSTVWDISQCTVLYPNNAPVHFYHAFNQPKILDRQELRLQFERGDLTLFEWVPTRLSLTGLCTNEQVETLKRIFPACTIKSMDPSTEVRVVQGRFRPIQFHQKIVLDTGESQTKSDVYEGLLRGMLADQLRWLVNRSSPRVIDAGNAVNSLAIAARADAMAIRLS
jgi:predicted dehydrogenase